MSEYEARKRALKFINEVHCIETALDEEEQLCMAEVENIDAGKQVIFGSTRFLSNNFRLLTADRKALRALTCGNNCGAIHQRLQGRVLCLERLLLLLIIDIVFETVRSRVLLCAAFDRAFNEPFHADLQTDQADAERIL